MKYRVPVDYCSRADRPFTVAHIASDTRATDPVSPGGRTRCGQVMKAEELWQPVGLLSGDRVCPDCQAGMAPAEEVQEALL